MISAEDCFAVWAPDQSYWSQWAKPVVFANATVFSEEPAPDLPSLDRPGIPHGFDPAAIVIDLPGPEAVRFGLAFAARGWRPVPLFNGTSGPEEVVPVAPIEKALSAGATMLKTLSLSAEARPVFLIDSDRSNPIGAGEAGRYDNRWVVLPQDFPSATALLSHGVKEVVVIRQRTLTPDQDLTYVLLRWQEAGLSVRGVALETGLTENPLSLAVPAQVRRLWYGALSLLGLRRSSVGGFGATVPQETRGSGYYG